MALQEQERLRLRRYGDMLRSEAEGRRREERRAREEALREESRHLQRHIEETRRYEEMKRVERREMQHAIRDDNMRLSTIKREPSTGQELRGENFLSHIQELDSRRLGKLKEGLLQQSQQNHENISCRRQLEEKIRQIEKEEAQRHAEKVREEQMNSERTYQQIKRRHQQDMRLYEKHRRLVEDNESYRGQIEAFTQGKGAMDKIYRDEQLQRRGELRDHQEQIVKQMEEFERRKERESAEYKRSAGDLESSMLGRVISKPQRNQLRAYSNDLRTQMGEDSRRRAQESRARRERVQVSGIYGGVMGADREKIVKRIDKSLGLDQYDIPPKKQEYQTISPNPQSLSLSLDLPLPPRPNSKRTIPYQQQPPLSLSQQVALPSISPSPRKCFKSYDFISGKNRFYGSD